MRIRVHYEVKISDPGPALTSEAISGCEKNLGVQFPVAYRDLLMVHNGGKPKRP